MSKAVVHSISMYPLIIPLRRTVEHAASQRRVSDPVVVGVELTGGTVGYGETLPRAYVTGESVDSVVAAVREVFAPIALEFHPDSFPEALEAIEALPWRDAAGSPAPAARAAVELALLDATMRIFDRSVEDIVQWMGLPGFGSPGSGKHIRFSGVLAAPDVQSTLQQLRKMYWGGLRSFKLKVGVDNDWQRLEGVCRYLRGPIAAGRASVRVDANGCWVKEDALDWLARASELPLAAVEQPLAKGKEDELPELAERFNVALWHDESLVTMEDAQRLVALGIAGGFNVRISKCGGLMPTLRLAAYARRSDVGVQLGCMVGETSILSAAGLRFLRVCPDVVWAEGCFGSFLLKGDVVTRPLRFGYGGSLPPVAGPGWGVDVDATKQAALCETAPAVIHL